MLPVYFSLPPFLLLSAFSCKPQSLTHSSHTKYVCITATSLHQTRLAIFFFRISFSSVFHALFHMLYFHALFHISSVFHALFPCFISHFLSFPCFVSHMMDLLWILFQLLQHLLYTVKMKSSPETAFSISKHSILTHSPLKINWKM